VRVARVLSSLPFLLLLALPACAAAPADTTVSETVAVSGFGRARVVPDRLVFTVGVETTATTVDAAVRENNERAAAITAALKRAGVAEDEIQTSNLSVNPQYAYEEGKRPRIVGFQVMNNLTVTRDAKAGLGTLLQAAIEAGANHVGSVGFSVADPARGRDQALGAAFTDARAKAELLARAAGRSLGRVVSITESGVQNMPPPRPAYRMMAEAAAQSMPVEYGTEEVAYTVTVIFELR
jgi:uncharacterized protein YggE